jgi:hypothetical protein
LESQNGSYLQSCLYDKNSDVNRTCPIFAIETIMKEVQAENDSDIYLYVRVFVYSFAESMPEV